MLYLSRQDIDSHDPMIHFEMGTVGTPGFHIDPVIADLWE